MQAAIFYLPFKLWSVLESGLVASFGTDGKSPVMLSEDAKYDDGVVQVRHRNQILCRSNQEFLMQTFCTKMFAGNSVGQVEDV